MVKYEATPGRSAQPSSAQLDAVFTALAHPARRSMLARLGRGEATVAELAEPLAISLPAVTKHLKVLERAQLISRGRNAQWRPCTLQVQPLQAASGWLEAQRAVWEARLDRLEAYLHQMQAEAAPVAPAEAAAPTAAKRPPVKTPSPPKGQRRG